VDETWRLIETCHAIVYFAPETKPVYTAAGLKGYWMGYFASRSAPLGSPPPEVVTATFYHFAPRMVARAIPDAWRYSSSEAVLAARLEIADRALRRLLGEYADDPAFAEAAALARRAVEAAPAPGRALFAAHAGLPPPDAPHLALWHAVTALREFRGDGHTAALLAAGVDGCEANVFAGALGVTPPQQREFRGFSEDEWSAAAGRLRSRGWLDETGAATDVGRAQRRAIEETTDALAVPPLDALGRDDAARLTDLLREPVRRIVDGGGIPFPNAMGMDRP
jgi:GNAT superfamily N-acetyltransferase